MKIIASPLQVKLRFYVRIYWQFKLLMSIKGRRGTANENSYVVIMHNEPISITIT